MIALLPVTNFFFAPNFREFNKYIAVLNGEPEVIPNVFELSLNMDNFDLKPFNDFYLNQGVKTTYFIFNSSRKLLIWAVIITLMPIAYGASKCLEGKGKLGELSLKID